ncbi:MAG: nuclease-related domain-containing protein [Thermoproteota archaeon]
MSRPVFRSRAKANFYRNLIILLIALFAFCEAAMFILTQQGYFMLFPQLLVIIPLWIFTPCLKIVYSKYQIWSAGAEGEENVAEVLGSLKGFETVSDVVLPGGKANIDHVVVSTKGVFVIETKNHKGLVRCRGDAWTLLKTGRKGTVYSSDIGNPSKQVKGNALALRRFLSERLGINTYVNGIVCFTNLETRLETWSPTVTVLHISNLRSFFQTLKEQNVISEEDVKRIKAEVEKYSYSRS